MWGRGGDGGRCKRQPEVGARLLASAPFVLRQAQDEGLYQVSMIMTHRDRGGGPSGRRGAADDAGHRQNFPTPSNGPPPRPERRLAEAFGLGAFGRRRARLPMPGIATAHAPSRKPWEAVSMGHYHRDLVLESPPSICQPAKGMQAPARRRQGTEIDPDKIMFFGSVPRRSGRRLRWSVCFPCRRAGIFRSRCRRCAAVFGELPRYPCRS